MWFPFVNIFCRPSVQYAQWLESWRQREDLKLVFNRRMRNRMYGGVEGVRSNAAPIPIAVVPRL